MQYTPEHIARYFSNICFRIMNEKTITDGWIVLAG